jgi:cellobiose epimerase
MILNFNDFKQQLENELTNNILSFWAKEVYNPKQKMFIGRITNEGEKFDEAPLSAVFVSRIMWTFAAAYRVYPNNTYKNLADEAFRILLENFWDQENGGIYWSIFPDGKPENTKKQFYAQAFFIYALSEYYIAFKIEKAKQIAVSVFMLLEKYASDTEFGGYIEAKTTDWKDINDQRLSPKDLDVRKSMNTHLHILEAYTNLSRIYKSKQVKEQLEHLIQIFLDKIIDSKTGHLILFFDDDWTIRSKINSYGHNIESTWLLFDAAKELGDLEIIEDVQRVILKTAAITAKEGLAKHGGIYYEKDGIYLSKHFHWWPQAEAVIGFFNVWQISKTEKYLQFSLDGWEFIQKNIIDKKNGEWFWGVDENLNPLEEDKINSWKAPYHNARMCLEMISRIESLGIK